MIEIELLLFILLSLLLFLIIYLVYRLKEYNKPHAFIYYVLFIIFYGPSFYYVVLDFNAYKYFSKNSLNIYLLYGIGIYFITILCILLNYIFIKNISNKINIFNSIKDTLQLRIYFLFLSIFPIIYIILYYKNLTFFHFLLYGELIERADITGNIPHYFTYISIVNYLIPSIYFFYFYKIKNKILHLFFNLFIIIGFIAGGNKGFAAFYMIFIWMYLFKYKINFKIIIIVVFLLFIYAITKGVSDINAEVLTYIIDSPTRRMFVTQGVCFIYRIEFWLHHIPVFSGDTLKQTVYYFMYNHTPFPGRAPTFFLGDILYYYGLFVSYFVYILYLILIMFVSNLIYNLNTEYKLFFYWLLFSVIYLLGMAQLDIGNFVRIVVMLLHIIMVFILTRKYKIFNNNQIKRRLKC